MKRLGRFFALRPCERILLVIAATLMLAFRLALWLLPFRRVMALAAQIRGSLPEVGGSRAERIAWAVRVVSRYIPRATCLVQALTAKALLESAGFPANLHIGVAKGEHESFEAHAWIETEGRVISGAGGLERYSPLMRWERECSH